MAASKLLRVRGSIILTSMFARHDTYSVIAVSEMPLFSAEIQHTEHEEIINDT